MTAYWLARLDCAGCLLQSENQINYLGFSTLKVLRLLGCTAGRETLGRT